MKGINLFLADGFEDVEALATHDVLRRAGIPVRLVAVGDTPFVTSSRGVTIGVGCMLEDADMLSEGTDDKDVMIFPGGMPGSRNLASCRPLIEAMKNHYSHGGTVAAICAAPGLVVSQLPDLSGVEFTCFDGFEQELISKGGVFRPVPAFRSGRIITGRSAGHTMAFALEIVSLLAPSKLEEVRHGLFLQTDVQ